MAARTLLHLVLKIVGLFFIRDMFIAVPSLISLIHMSWMMKGEVAISTLIISVVTVTVYALIVYLLLFKTNWLLDIMKLEEGFPEDPVPLRIHRSTVLTIVIIVVGLLLVVQTLPLLVKEMTQWYKHTKAQTGFLESEMPFDYTMLLVYLVQLVIAIMLISNQKLIVNFIEYQSRNSNMRRDRG